MNPLSPAFMDQLRFNEAGLIPAVAQDWLDGAVLMVAWMNRESIQKTLQSGEVHYWSRSRSELWHGVITHTTARRASVGGFSSVRIIQAPHKISAAFSGETGLCTRLPAATT